MEILTGGISCCRDAILIARKAVEDNVTIPIHPCVQVVEGKEIICPSLDKTGNVVCKEGDGLLPIDGGLECPSQKGRLVLMKSAEISASNTGSVESQITAHSIGRVGGPSRRERRPYLGQ